MKNLLRSLSVLLLLVSFKTFGQITTVYNEEFDSPPHAVTTYNKAPVGTVVPYWNDTTRFSVSPTMSMHVKDMGVDSIILETNSFSTIGNTFVRLQFSQICKIYYGHAAHIQVSNDGGTTWTTLNSTQYLGNSNSFKALGYFNETSYNNPNASPYWGGITVSTGGSTPNAGVTPTNSWWSFEQFDVSDELGQLNGFANCKVRFIYRRLAAMNGNSFPDGWYVDNIKVEAAPCELNAPEVLNTHTNAKLAQGARYQATEEIRVSVRDKGPRNDGVKDSTVLVYRFNGGAWQNQLMTKTGSAVCPDSAQFSYTFQNLVVGDTIDYYIEAYDCACPNLTRFPLVSSVPNYRTFFIDDAPPGTCGTTTSNSFPYVITTFPWTEDFENVNFWTAGTGTGNTGTTHRGSFPQGNPPSGQNWSVAPNTTSTGFAWSVRKNATGTANTGPDGDHTLNGLGTYLYTEASQTGSNSQLIIPCALPANMKHAVFEFWYHKYGANMGQLRIDVDTNQLSTVTNPNWVLNIDRVNGQTQTSSSDAWQKKIVNLDPYIGKIIKLRFVGFYNGGDKGDMAIDDLSIYEPDSVDIEIYATSAPQDGYCEYDLENPTISIRNLAFDPAYNIPVACAVVNTTNPTVPPVIITRDTITDTLLLGQTMTYTFNNTVDLSAYGDYELTMFTEMPGDQDNSNDSLAPVEIKHHAPINTFPFYETFDGPAWAPSTGSANQGTIDPNFPFSSVPNTNSSYRWFVGTSLTWTAETGPRRDMSWNGNYLYAEGDYGGASANAILWTKECVDFTTLTNPEMSFWYHMYGSDIDFLILQVKPTGTNTFVNVAPSLITPANINSLDDWKYKSIDLSTYGGTIIDMRLIGRKKATGGSKSDIAIDNLLIYNNPTNDVGVAIVKTPLTGIDTAIHTGPQIMIFNYGSSSASNIPISYTLKDMCNGTVKSYTATYTGTITANNSALFTLPAVDYFLGTNQIKAWTNSTTDAFHPNDTAVRYIVGTNTKLIPYGPVNFDNCTYETEGFYPASGINLFETGAPVKIGLNTASSSPNVWQTGLTRSYQPNTEEILYAPVLDNFDTIVGAELRFKHRFNWSNGDGGLIEYKVNNTTWAPLGNASVSVGTNWYGSSYGAPSVTALGGPGWTLTTGGSWITSSIPLNVWNMNQAPLNLRFRMKSISGSSGAGWSIDDFEIYVPPQNSASPVDVDTREYLIIPNEASHIRVKIENTGAKRLDSCLVRYQVNGGAWSNYETVVFPNNGLLRGASMWYEFQQTWTNQGANNYNICVETYKPNAKNDNLITDDSKCEIFPVSDYITLDQNDSTYCNDFENSTLAAWIPLHAKVKTKAQDWQFGSPSQAPILGASSGTNAWMTQLGVNYNSVGNSALHTPFFELDSSLVYEVSFNHYMVSELYHDGGSFDFSYDGGVTWYTLGGNLPSGQWYNTNHVTALDIVRPGWSGNTQGWINSNLTFTVENSGKVVFRFRFATDYSIDTIGWAIDDFCLTVTNKSPIFIGIGQDEYDNAFGFGNLMPNPSTGMTVLPYVAQNEGPVNITITNTVGQIMQTRTERISSGNGELSFNLSGYAPGMYMINAEFEGQVYTRKLIISQ